MEMIRREAKHAREGKPARIVAKMNALVEEQVIRALYAASCDGVQIDLIVRGACALRPGVPGLSENIRVRSILGRFLEHHRVWRFANAGEDDVWLASADWMGRNLFRRIEVAFPVRDPELKARVIDEGLDVYLTDTCDAWELHADGTWSPSRPEARRQAAIRAGGAARAIARATGEGADRDGPDPVAACGGRAGRAGSRPAADGEGRQAGRPRGHVARAPPAGQLPHPGLARTARRSRRRRRSGASSRPSPSSRPGASVASVLAAANWPDSREPVLIVGHQPTLGEVASLLLAGEEAGWSIRKGAVWWLCDRDRDGSAAVLLRVAIGPDFV